MVTSPHRALHTRGAYGYVEGWHSTPPPLPLQHIEVPHSTPAQVKCRVGRGKGWQGGPGEGWEWLVVKERVGGFALLDVFVCYVACSCTPVVSHRSSPWGRGEWRHFKTMVTCW